MENTNFNIEVKNAFLVTKDEIKEVSSFSFSKVGSYGGNTEILHYLTEKGWQEVSNSSWSTEGLVYTTEEAQELKKTKMTTHLNYLKTEKERNEKAIIEIEAALAK